MTNANHSLPARTRLQKTTKATPLSTVNGAPHYPLHKPSSLATDKACSLPDPNYKPSTDLSNLSLDHFSFDDLEELLSVSPFPDAFPNQYLHNHLAICRQQHLKFDGMGRINTLPADRYTYKPDFDIEAQLKEAQKINTDYKHLSIKIDHRRTFEFVGLAKGVKASADNTKQIQWFKSVDGVAVLMLRKKGFYDSVFFDAGNNIAAYLNYLFNHPDMDGDAEFSRVIALYCYQNDLWDIARTPKTYLNSNISSIAELINDYAENSSDFGAEGIKFYCLNDGNLDYLFYGKEIVQQYDPEFLSVVQPKQNEHQRYLKRLNENYVDQSVFMIPESNFAVMTHLYARSNSSSYWNETVNVVHSENMMDILQALQDQDLRDQFMVYLQSHKVQSTFVIKRDNEPDLQFTGSLLGFASNRKFQDLPNTDVEAKPSQNTNRWTELALYLTKGGSYVCHQANYSLLPGEHNKFDARVTKVKDEVTDFFGYRWLAKTLYESARFNANQIID